MGKNRTRILIRNGAWPAAGDRPAAGDAPTFRTPHQARSRETQRRIVAATQELLSEKPAEAVTVADITRRAASSVGAFYARFPDKGALLRHLGELYRAEVERFEQHFGQDPRWGSASARERLRAAILFYTRLHKKYGGLLRARLHEAPVVGARAAGAGAGPDARGLPGTAFLAREVMRHRRAMSHPDPEGASELGAMMVMGAIRERMLFGPATRPSALTENALAVELTNALIAYLGIDEASLIRVSDEDESGPV